jgi:hypothetical protein
VSDYLESAGANIAKAKRARKQSNAVKKAQTLPLLFKAKQDIAKAEDFLLTSDKVLHDAVRGLASIIDLKSGSKFFTIKESMPQVYEITLEGGTTLEIRLSEIRNENSDKELLADELRVFFSSAIKKLHKSLAELERLNGELETTRSSLKP